MEPLITTERLSRTFHGRKVVDGLDFSLHRGQILGLLGPNGAGKSTALRMICGDLAASSGTIRICGHDLQAEPIAAKRQLGYLPERPPLHPDQRVIEYLQDAARLHRIPRKRLDSAIDNAMQYCGLETVSRRLIRKLSKGFQQRVGIAQAILHQPALIILDEPTDGLDPTQLREVRELIRKLAENAGVIISSHILPEIQNLCQQVLILQDGVTVYAGAITPPETQSLKLWLAHPPELDQLAALPMVSEAQQLHSDYFQLILEAQTDPSLLASQIVERGWGLKALTPQSLSLEQIFMQATSGAGNP
ncbi:MAG: ABC transporter ATP-binding protein [Gammaproteobacteria bacterium]|nr:ABC transporter ATP-binding protein [Gammaproteobacteria bacterium]